MLRSCDFVMQELVIALIDTTRITLDEELLNKEKK
jgi:hypothetical protein